MVIASVKVMSPEEIIARSGGETPFLMPPERATVFAERAMRLRQLAPQHAMGDFLNFMAELALAQQRLLADFPAVPLPDAAALDRAARAGQGPLPAADWPRDAAWCDGLRRLATDLAPHAPAGLRPRLQALSNADDAWLEAQADCLLSGVMQGLDLSSSSVVAAALQVYWTQMVSRVQAQHAGGGAPFGRIDDARACPCCASRPTASITRLSGAASGQRYLHCALCAMQWHLVRIQCSQCGSGKSLAYQSLASSALDGEDEEAAQARAATAAIQAETCDECGHYLKIMHAERDPHVEPVADDLASITLDLLVSAAGRQRHGLNYMLLFGEPDPPPAPTDTP